MAKTAPVDPKSVEIGRRARLIRRRRGLSQNVVAGLAGFTDGYLSMLETGKRAFQRHSLIENLARALGCSVTDLTGEPYLPVSPAIADAMAVLPAIRESIYDSALDDPPDRPARSLVELQRWVKQAHQYVDQDRYGLAGRELESLLAELHVHAASDNADIQRAALAALVEACHIVCVIAWTTGCSDFGLAVATREYEAAVRLDDPVALGLARFARAISWTGVGARRRAETMNEVALAGLQPVADPSAADTGVAEMLGINHLYAAKLTARTGRADIAHDHLGEARVLAERTGECNTAMQHFGPTNVELWTLAVGVNLGEGPRAYERAHPDRINIDCLNSRVRTGFYHLDLARALAQDGGGRDGEAIRHLDLADRTAPVLVRGNTIARELLIELSQRARRRVWELDSLCNRFGVNEERSGRST
ncbi:MAG: helix-turn-helix domain-containing protein [Pseudonocardiaceae bacterium]